jgi:hypothetical protein
MLTLTLFITLVCHLPVRAQEDYCSFIEKEIQSDKSTADFIVGTHPRLWAKGVSEWDYETIGSIAWRIVHGNVMDPADPANDQQKDEFYYVAYLADDPEMYGADDGGTFGRRFLWTILAGHSLRYGWDEKLPSSLEPYSSGFYDPSHTADEYYADARKKLLGLANISEFYEWPYWICIYGSVGYDWLVASTYSNGQPVLSEPDQQFMQDLLITNADHVKNNAEGDEHFFYSPEIADYVYAMVGLALYEPNRIDDASYTDVNDKAIEYLDDFDTYWIGHIIPALNRQGGDGGWHGGFDMMSQNFDPYYSGHSVLPWEVAPILFAHYTATGLKIEQSLFSTGFVKHGAEFQAYMIRSNETYYPPVPPDDYRMTWIAPMRMYSRRRFSDDAEQKKIGELGAWVRAEKSPDWFVDAGSYDLFEQTLFEDKWVNPRSPDKLGYPDCRHFSQLGWVFIRPDFTARNGLGILFTCQRYRWSSLDPYDQNSFMIDYKGELIQNMKNTILLDGKGQRTISSFPTLSEGIDQYAPGSSWDIGPGIIYFDDNDLYTVLTGDATNACQPDKLDQFTRSLIYLKDEKILILFDTVITPPNIAKSWTIDPVNTPQLVSDRTYRISNGSGALFLKQLLPAEINLSSQTSSKFELSPASNSDSLFLHVMQVAEADESIGSQNVIADEAVLFEQTPERVGLNIKEWNITFQNSEILIENNALDVSLISFSGEYQQHKIILNWKSVTEPNTLGFQIDRKTEQIPFHKIGFVQITSSERDTQTYRYIDSEIDPNTMYYYRLSMLNRDGSRQYSPVICVPAMLPEKLKLLQNYPNPFNPGTRIEYTVPESMRVKLDIFDTMGRHIITLVDKQQPPGTYHIQWDGRNQNNQRLAGGVYIYRLTVGNQTLTRKMVLVK